MNQEYQHIAPVYDLFTGCFMNSLRNDIAAMLVKYGHDSNSQCLKIIDIGCGTGMQMRAFLSAGLNVITGLDSSYHMLEVAQKNLYQAKNKTKTEYSNQAEYHFAYPKLVLGSGVQIPFADSSFDVAIISLLLHECGGDRAQKILAEASRVAQKILVLDWKMPERNLDFIAHCPVQIIERMAGKRHYHNFKGFMASGGMEGLIYRHNLSCKSESLNTATDNKNTAVTKFFTCGQETQYKLHIANRKILRFGSMVLLDIQRA